MRDFSSTERVAHHMLTVTVAYSILPVTLSVKLPLASCPLVAVTRQVYVPPSLVEVVLTAKMCSL